MSLTWKMPAAVITRGDDADDSDPPTERLRLCIALPVLLGVSALLWGGIGLTIAWLIG